jgi:hypothetical protein
LLSGIQRAIFMTPSNFISPLADPLNSAILKAMQTLLNSWWMSALKIHAPILLLEVAAILAIANGAAALLQRSIPWSSPRTQSQWRPFSAPVNILGALLALLLGVHSSLSAIGHQRQLQALLEALRTGGQGQAPTGTTPAQPGAGAQTNSQEAATQAKAQFLTELEGVLASPTQANVEAVRAAIEKKYPGLLAKDGAPIRKQYLDAIVSVYQCQKAFADDALATLKTRRVEKSALRAKCEATSGAFFLRPLLIPEEQAKANQATLEKLARGEKVGEPALTAESIQATATLEARRVSLAKEILK